MEAVQVWKTEGLQYGNPQLLFGKVDLKQRTGFASKRINLSNMRHYSLWAATLLAVAHNALALEWSATYGHTPAPFTLSVNPEIIALAHQKAILTRHPVDVEQPDWSDGPPVHNATSVRDYWVNEYDWSKTQEGINSQ